jgi:hypothetical protein
MTLTERAVILGLQLIPPDYDASQTHNQAHNELEMWRESESVGFGFSPLNLSDFGFYIAQQPNRTVIFDVVQILSLNVKNQTHQCTEVHAVSLLICLNLMVRSDCVIVALRSQRSSLPYFCHPMKSNTARRLERLSDRGRATANQILRHRDEYNYKHYWMHCIVLIRTFFKFNYFGVYT